MGESAFCRFLKGVPPTGLNQYGSVGGVSYSYDDNGTLIDDGTYLYYYDCENRLTGVDEEVSYKYDFAGRRVKKIASGNPDVITKYCYDGDQVIAEYDGSNTLLRRFVYGPGIDEPVCMIDVADSNAVYYYHYDGLGSVVALSDANGVIVERYKYDVFGQPMIIDPNNEQLTTSNYGNPYMFTGRRYDSEVGLYYYRFRYYRPEIGRFLQTDPIGYFAGLNLYTYVGNNPLNWLDPFGLCEKDKEKETSHYHNLKVKELEALLGKRLTREEFEDLMEYTIEYLLERSRLVWGNWNFIGTYFYRTDSIFGSDAYKNLRFNYQGMSYTGEQINYYPEGVLHAHLGLPEWWSRRLVRLNNWLHGHPPTAGEYIWDTFGYMEYGYWVNKLKYRPHRFDLDYFNYIGP